MDSTTLGPWAVGWASLHGDEGILVPPDLSTQPLSCLVLTLTFSELPGFPEDRNA